MNDEVYEVIEGEVVDPGDGPRMDPWIERELEDFNRQMDQMRWAYMLAADGIARGAIRTAPPPEPVGPVLIHKMGRAFGLALVGAGSWLLERYDLDDKDEDEEQKEQSWAWANQDDDLTPVQLPRPNVDETEIRSE